MWALFTAKWSSRDHCSACRQAKWSKCRMIYGVNYKCLCTTFMEAKKLANQGLNSEEEENV
jgi:hypothetical protein